MLDDRISVAYAVGSAVTAATGGSVPVESDDTLVGER